MNIRLAHLSLDDDEMYLHTKEKTTENIKTRYEENSYSNSMILQTMSILIIVRFACDSVNDNTSFGLL